MKTPQQSYPALARAISIPTMIYLKREDLHPYGSHKGRAIPLMIKIYAKKGVQNFVISSSGNAALAAIKSVEKHNKNNNDTPITLSIFVGKNIHADKFLVLKKEIGQNKKIALIQTDRPKQSALRVAKEKNSVCLRQSTDDLALEGYTELAHELTKIPDLSAVFVPTSSGTTAQALGKIFLNRDMPIQLHIIQTSACHPIAEAYDTNAHACQTNERSLADAIVDNVAYRKKNVLELIKKTHGYGWIPDEKTIKKAQQLIKEYTHIETTPNGALGVAGVLCAIEKGIVFTDPVACLICGR